MEKRHSGVLRVMKAVIGALLVVPLPLFAVTIVDILNLFVIPLLFAFALVIFLWGVYKYISSASIEGKEGARVTIIYGIIGLFVMLSAWGLVRVLTSTFFSSAVLKPPIDFPTAPVIP